jgi:hypothetical protein
MFITTYLNTKVITRSKDLHSGHKTPHVEDRGLARLEEVFIQEFFIFRAVEHSCNIQEIGQV